MGGRATSAAGLGLEEEEQGSIMLFWMDGVGELRLEVRQREGERESGRDTARREGMSSTQCTSNVLMLPGD